MPFSDIVSIIIFILPGFIANKVYSEHYAGIKDSDFGRIVNSVIYSIFILLITDLLFNIFSFEFKISSDDLLSLNTIFLLIFAYAFGQFLILFEKIKRRVVKDKSFELSSWATVNSGIGREKWVVVFLKDSSIYRGYLKYWKFDPDSPSEFDFFISRASFIDSSLKTIYRVDGPGVYVRANEVQRIEYLD